MAQAMFRSAIALQQLGCIVLPDAPFNTGGQCGAGRGGAGMCTFALPSSRTAVKVCACIPPRRTLPTSPCALLLLSWPHCAAEEQRFEQRFSFMEQLCRPDPVPYAHFAAVTSAQGVPPARVLASAQASAGQDTVSCCLAGQPLTCTMCLLLNMHGRSALF